SRASAIRLCRAPCSARATIAVRSLMKVPVYIFPTSEFGFLPRNPSADLGLRTPDPNCQGLTSAVVSRIFNSVRFFQNLNARHAITAVPGTPAGFPESNFKELTSDLSPWPLD